MGLRVSEKKIFKLFPIISLWEPVNPGVWPVWTLGYGWQDLSRDHLTLLHTKYLSSGPYGFRKEDFFFFFLRFFNYKSMGANEPWGVVSFDPREMVGRIYVGDHLTLLHTTNLSSGPYGFRKEDF